MDTYILIHRKKRICTTAIVPICMTDHKVWCMYQLSRSVLSDSLQPHGLQHARLPCPSPPPRACSNSCLSSHLTLCRPLLLLPSILPNIRVFSNALALGIRWPKYWSFSFSTSPSKSQFSSVTQSFLTLYDRMDCSAQGFPVHH